MVATRYGQLLVHRVRGGGPDWPVLSEIDGVYTAESLRAAKSNLYTAAASNVCGWNPQPRGTTHKRNASGEGFGEIQDSGTTARRERF